MDDLIRRILLITDEMASRLPQVGYEELAAFVQERERLIQQLRKLEPGAEFWQTWKSQVEAMEEWTPAVLLRMTELRQEAQSGLNRTRTAQKQRHVYDPSYQPDSILFDRKK